MGLHPLHHGLFDDGLAGGHRVQLGGDGVALHREGRVPGQILLPGDGPGALKQLLKAAGREPAQHQQHPRPAAQVDVQPRQVGQFSPAQHPAVFHLHVLQAQPPDLVAHQFFQPQQAGHHKCMHIAPRFVIWGHCSMSSSCSGVSATRGAPAASRAARPRNPQATPIMSSPAFRAVATSTSLSPTYRVSSGAA